MRAILGISLLLVAVSAKSQESTLGPEADRVPQRQVTKPNNGVNVDQQYAKKQAPIVRPSPSIPENDLQQNAPNESDRSPIYDVLYTVINSVAIVVIAVFTVALARSTKKLWAETAKTAAIAKESAEIVFVSSMPVLSPLVVVEHTNLHPLTAGTPTFTSKVSFVFENFGKTPAMIRETRAALYLNEMDSFPEVDFESLPSLGYEPIVSGDARGKAALLGVAECYQKMNLSKTEFSELLAEASSKKYRRFALIGQVVYDDFFGVQHTRRFCVKLRNMRGGLFQLVRGGDRYNQITRKRLPND